MPAANYNFTIEQGSSFAISFQYLDNEQKPIDITNWCARLRWKEDVIDPDTGENRIRIFVTPTISAEYSFTTIPKEGKMILKIPADETAKYDFNTAKYDLELQEPNDLYSGGGKIVFRILQGNINLTRPNVPDPDQPFDCNPDSNNPDVHPGCGTC